MRNFPTLDSKAQKILSILLLHIGVRVDVSFYPFLHT